MSDPLVQRILANTFTKADFYRAIDCAQEYLEGVFYNTDDSDDTDHVDRIIAYAHKRGDVVISERLSGWGDLVLNTFTRGNLYDEVRRIKAAIEGLPELVLYVPVPLGQVEIASIGTWCRQEVDGDVLLVINVDSDVVGGCSFVWNGVHHTFALDHFFKKKEKEVLDVIHSFDA